jgi:tetratricopeptide (TPR) repeat protein
MQRLVMLIVTVVCWSHAMAFPPERMTKAEIALLPPYCAHTQPDGLLGSRESQTNPSPKAQRWMEFLGGGPGHDNNLWKIHHYCWALIRMARAEKFNITRQDRRHEWSLVVGEIDYTMEHSTPDLVLLPEMWLNRGRALVRLGQHEEALQSFARAIEIKPDYWPPYVDSANILAARGATAQAIRLLEDALKHAPEARTVKTRLAELRSGAKR